MRAIPITASEVQRGAQFAGTDLPSHLRHHAVHGGSKASEKGVAAHVAAGGYDVAPTGDDVAYHAVPSSEYPRIEKCVSLAPNKSRMRVVQDHEVGAAAWCDDAGRHAQSMGAAAAGPFKEMSADRVSCRCKPVALSLPQALSILERAQFLTQCDPHIAVRTDGEAATGVEESRRREDAVAEIGFRD